MKIALTPALAAAIDRYRRALAALKRRQAVTKRPAAEFRRDEGGGNARRAVIAGPRDRREEDGEARGGEVEKDGAHSPKCAPVLPEEVLSYSGGHCREGHGNCGRD